MRVSHVHQCLLEVPAAGQAEFGPVLFNITFLLMMLVGPNLWWWLVISYLIHQVLRWMYRKDPYTSRIFVRYLKEADIYDPWVRAGQLTNIRPYGAGRELLC